jgi:hypothetical protein
MRLFGIPWDFVAILLVLAVAVPWRGTVRIRELLKRPSLGTRERIALYASTIAFQWIAVAIIFWRALCAALHLRSWHWWLGIPRAQSPSPWV